MQGFFKLFIFIFLFSISFQSGIDLTEITNLHAQIAEASKSSNRLLSSPAAQVQKKPENSLKVPQLVDHLKDEDMHLYSYAPVNERKLLDRALVNEPEVKKMLDASAVQPSLKGRVLSDKKSKKSKSQEVVVKFEEIPKKSKKLTDFTKNRKLADSQPTARKLLDYTTRDMGIKARYLKPVPSKIF